MSSVPNFTPLTVARGLGVSAAWAAITMQAPSAARKGFICIIMEGTLLRVQFQKHPRLGNAAPCQTSLRARAAKAD
jgi:hypothetical protein